MHRKLQLSIGKPVKNNFQFYGFTLIEILVSISVISILLGITYAGYAAFDLRQKLVAAGQTMKNILRDAQSRSYNGEVDCSVCYCSDNTAAPSLIGWNVDFTNRKIYGQCGNNSFSASLFNLPAEVVITPFVTPVLPEAKLLFRRFPSGADQQATICVSRSDLASSYYKIMVNSAGTISDSGGIVSPCVP